MPERKHINSKPFQRNVPSDAEQLWPRTARITRSEHLLKEQHTTPAQLCDDPDMGVLWASWFLTVLLSLQSDNQLFKIALRNTGRIDNEAQSTHPGRADAIMFK